MLVQTGSYYANLFFFTSKQKGGNSPRSWSLVTVQRHFVQPTIIPLFNLYPIATLKSHDEIIESNVMSSHIHDYVIPNTELIILSQIKATDSHTLHYLFLLLIAKKSRLSRCFMTDIFPSGGQGFIRSIGIFLCLYKVQGIQNHYYEKHLNYMTWLPFILINQNILTSDFRRKKTVIFFLSN